MMISAAVVVVVAAVSTRRRRMLRRTFRRLHILAFAFPVGSLMHDISEQEKVLLKGSRSTVLSCGLWPRPRRRSCSDNNLCMLRFLRFLDHQAWQANLLQVLSWPKNLLYLLLLNV